MCAVDGLQPQCLLLRVSSSSVFRSEFFHKQNQLSMKAMLLRGVSETQGREFQFQRVGIKVFGMKNILLEWWWSPTKIYMYVT